MREPRGTGAGGAGAAAGGAAVPGPAGAAPAAGGAAFAARVDVVAAAALTAVLFAGEGGGPLPGADGPGTDGRPDVPGSGGRRPSVPGSAGRAGQRRGDGTGAASPDGWGRVHGPWRRLIATEPFRQRRGRSADAQLRTAYRRLRLVSEAAGRGLAPAADTAVLTALHEWIAPVDTALATVAGIHYNLFLGSLLDHGAAGAPPHGQPREPGEPADVLAPYARLDRVGTFLCTEVEHGNDAAALETVAVHDPARDGFVLRTPHAGAQKFMPNTSAVGGPKDGLVAARLLVDGRDEGVFLFLTPLTGPGGPLPGVRVRRLPERLGSAVDHCLTSFDDVFVGRGALLSGPQGRLDAAGAFRSATANRRRRFLWSIGRVTAGKLCMSACAVGSVRAALAVAVRYGHHRLITGARRGERVPVFAHRSHHGPLVEALATAWAMTLLHRSVQRHWLRAAPRHGAGARPGGEAAAAERDVAVAKAWITWEARTVLAECRERCGAQGLLAGNRLAEFLSGVEGAVTAEGDNLAIQAKAAAELVSGPPPSRPAPGPAGRGLGDAEFLRELLAAAEALGLDRAAAAMAAARAGDPLGRWNAGAGAALAAATARAERLAVEALAGGAPAVRGPGASRARALLVRLERLFALRRVARHAGELLAAGYLEPGQVRALPAELERAIAELAGHAPTLVESFAVPAEWLADVPLAVPGRPEVYDDPGGPWHGGGARAPDGGAAAGRRGGPADRPADPEGSHDAPFGAEHPHHRQTTAKLGKHP